MNYVYFTATLDAAVWGAELAAVRGAGASTSSSPRGVRGRPERDRQEVPGESDAVLP